MSATIGRGTDKRANCYPTPSSIVESAHTRPRLNPVLWVITSTLLNNIRNGECWVTPLKYCATTHRSNTSSTPSRIGRVCIEAFGLNRFQGHRVIIDTAESDFNVDCVTSRDSLISNRPKLPSPCAETPTAKSRKGFSREIQDKMGRGRRQDLVQRPVFNRNRIVFCPRWESSVLSAYTNAKVLKRLTRKRVFSILIP